MPQVPFSIKYWKYIDDLDAGTSINIRCVCGILNHSKIILNYKIEKNLNLKTCSCNKMSDSENEEMQEEEQVLEEQEQEQEEEEVEQEVEEEVVEEEEEEEQNT